MRRISEMFDDLRIIESIVEKTQEQDVFETMDRESEERVLKMAMSKINGNSFEPAKEPVKKNIHVFHKKRLAFVALVAALLVASLSVSAQYGEGIERVIEVIKEFHLRDSLAEHVGMEADAGVEGVVASDILQGEETKTEYGGVSVAVEQMITDGEDAYVYFSVNIPENLVPKPSGEGMETSLSFRKCEVRLGENDPFGTWFYIRQDANGQHYGIVSIPLEDVEEASYKVTMTLHDIEYIIYKAPKPTRETLLEGTWEMKWVMDCKKIADKFDFSAVIDAHDGIVTIDEVILSPLSVRVEGTIACDDPTYSQVGAFIESVILTGNVIEENDGSWSKAEDGRYSMKCYFARVIPMEEIIGVVVDGEYLYFQ